MHHILVIEDDQATAYVYARYLKHRGYHASVADSGAIALRIAEKIAIDAVVADYNLGGMHGLDTVKALREVQPELPALIVSGFTDLFEVSDNRTKVLRKPVSLELLTATLAVMIAAET